ncbi:MAG: aminotransferase class V-fold PLP-dependent enzyme [Clostridiales bacterium]|nr:aminotransferase class V-fold PLP-dependent enzyme [Candidatus Crickella equi]
MEKIYLDNGATSFPKPKEVVDAVYEYMTSVGVNINRGGYQSAYDVASTVLETREMLCKMFNGKDCRNVAFTKNITESLNIVLKGFLKPGDHILCSSIEHNAVMRPLVQLAKTGVEFDRIPANERGEMDVDAIEGLIKPNTVAIVCTHASNVFGTLNPIDKIGEIAHQHSLKFFVDTAQTAGILPINMQEMHIDALCFTGHKSLLGPQGIGGFILDDDMVKKLDPLITGGTGSISHTEDTPEFMPDRFEAGTMNLPGILGLNAGLKWLEEKGLDNVLSGELELTQQFIDGLKPLIDAGKIKLYGMPGIKGRVGVVSIQTTEVDLAEAAFNLDLEYGIMTRVGMHCAPYAHQVLGSYPTGTIRFSFGNFNTREDVDAAIKALTEICNN